MKSQKNTIILTVFAVLILAGSAAFSKNDVDASNSVPTFPSEAVEYYVDALKFDNAGVVESAIFLSLKFKLFMPHSDTDALAKEVNRLAKKGATERIRYKAYIASQFFKNPAMLNNVERKNYRVNSDEFFRVLATELQKHMLAKN